VIGEKFAQFVTLIATLRSPQGCPWDREQTHHSLKSTLLEESYEVVEAIEQNDDAELCGELGDLLLQVIFHAQIATEENRFTIAEVISSIHDKMVRRHPHVFSDVTATTSNEVLRNWEAIKAAEKTARAPQAPPESMLNSVSKAMPALMEAFQITSRAARVNFDWPDAPSCLAKFEEELQELKTELNLPTANVTAAEKLAVTTDLASGVQANADLTTNDLSNQNPVSLRQNFDAIEDEVGDLLFMAVNLARLLQVDPESALKRANRKFRRRFAHIEQALAKQGKTPAQSNLAEMESGWQAEKQQEKITTMAADLTAQAES
jgi:tetrapyrrole methylase family protein / MazG family protein